MENKVVCYYCGTVYDEEKKKCPLCGSSVRSTDAADFPVQRRRLTEQERRQQRRKTTKETPAAKGRFAAAKTARPTKDLLTAALIFLALTVVLLGYFIGDMIGWWPGLEDLTDRNGQTEKVETGCVSLVLSSDTLTLSGAGATAELTVAVNPYCEETLYCNSADTAIASVAEQAQTAESEEEKTVTFTVTAAAPGETELTFTCGSQKKTCTVTVGDEALPGVTWATEAIPDDYEPLLSCGESVTFTQKGETQTLRVENLPGGYTAKWSSADASVAKIDAKGVLTAVGGGVTTVTVKVGDKTAELPVRCTFDGYDIGAHLELSDVTVRVGETFYLYLYDAEGEHITDATYSVGNTAVCKIEDNQVTSLASGTTTITVTYFDKEYECIVRVR